MANNIEKQIKAKILLDSTSFNKNIGDVNRQLKLTQSELQASSAKLGVFGKENDKLKVTSENLTRQIGLQNDKVKNYRELITATTTKLQDNIKAKDELKQQIEDTNVKYTQAIKLYGKESEEVSKLKNDLDGLQQEYKKKEKAIETNGKAIDNYTININKADTELAKMQSELNKTTIEIAKNESKWLSASKTLDNTSQKMKTIGTNMSKVGNGLTLGITLPLLAIGTASTKMAMDAVESENLFEVSMGSMAKNTRVWSEQLRKELGLNAYEVRKNVATYNAMLTSMGLSEKQAYQFSTSLTELANDMSSFYNLSTEDAFNKLKSGISGEAEPLKALGILVNDNTIKTYAYKNGIAELGKQLTEQQKVQARYGVIMQQTTKAQGDLARTIDSPTNKLRIQQERIKQISIDLGMKLLPLLEKGLNIIEPIIDYISNLNDEQRDLILKLGMVAVAMGPVLSITGKFINITGSVVGGIGKFSQALGTAKVATEGASAVVGTATSGIGSFGKVLASGTGLLNPWVLGIGAATIAGIGLYKHLQNESIPTVKLFGSETSASTQKVITSFMDLNTKATESLNQLNWSGQTVTNDMRTNIVGTFEQMGQQITQGLITHNGEQLNQMQTFFNQSNVLTVQEEAKIVEEMKKGNEQKVKNVDEGVKKIDEILKRASDAHRALTKAEQEEVNKIQKEMFNVGIQALSEYELTSKAILERIRIQQTTISAKQAAEVVKNSLEQKSKVAISAEEQANTVIKEIIRQRDEAKVISSDQADKLIMDALRQKDETIKNAEEMHKKVVEQAKLQSKDLVDEIDWQTGTVKTKWEKLIEYFKANPLKLSVNGVNPSYSPYIPKNYRGNSSFEGGLTTLHEEGYEVYDLPQGTRIYNHEASEDLVSKTAEAVARIVDKFNSNSPSPTSSTVNHYAIEMIVQSDDVMGAGTFVKFIEQNIKANGK